METSSDLQDKSAPCNPLTFCWKLGASLWNANEAYFCRSCYERSGHLDRADVLKQPLGLSLLLDNSRWTSLDVFNFS